MTDSGLLQAYRDHEWELLRFLARRLGSPATAADIAHDLYVKLLGEPELPQIRDSKAYLFGMAANLATDHLRVERRRGEILAEIDGVVWRRRDEMTPERHALARAELAFLATEIAGLPQRCREIFRLHRYEGLTQPQIADRLGIGITTVYKDLKLALETMLRARQRFRATAPQDKGHRK